MQKILTWLAKKARIRKSSLQTGSLWILFKIRSTCNEQRPYISASNTEINICNIKTDKNFIEIDGNLTSPFYNIY